MIKIWDEKTPAPAEECTKTGRTPNRNRQVVDGNDVDPRPITDFLADMTSVIRSANIKAASTVRSTQVGIAKI